MSFCTQWVRTVDPDSLKSGWSLSRSPVEPAPVSAAQIILHRNTRLQRFDSADHFMADDRGQGRPPIPPLLAAITADGHLQHTDHSDSTPPQALNMAAIPHPAPTACNTSTQKLEFCQELQPRLEVGHQEELPEHIKQRSAAFSLKSLLRAHQLDEHMSRQPCINASITPLLQYAEGLRKQIERFRQDLEVHAWPSTMETTLRKEVGKADSGWLRGHSKQSAESWLATLDAFRDAKAEDKRLKVGLVLKALMACMGITGIACCNVGELVIQAIAQRQNNEHEAETRQTRHPRVRYIKN